MIITPRASEQPTKLDAINQKRFDVGLAIASLTINQVATTYLVAQRILYQLKKDHGSLVEAQQKGLDGARRPERMGGRKLIYEIACNVFSVVLL